MTMCIIFPVYFIKVFQDGIDKLEIWIQDFKIRTITAKVCAKTFR